MKNHASEHSSHSNSKRRTFFRRLFGTMALGTVLAPFSKLAANDSNEPQRHPKPDAALVLEPMIGQVMLFAGNFAPRGWALCNGQLLPISQNQALFSILGTTYGGDGRTTFGLPDLRGRVPIHAGQGPGLTDRRLGSKGGNETQMLTVANLPAHHHDIRGSVDIPVNKKMVSGKPNKGNKNAAAQGSLLHSTTDSKDKYTGSTLSATTKNTGSNQAFNAMQPYLTINYVIALQGLYPSRS